MRTASTDGKNVFLKFSYDPGLIARVKCLPVRSWDSKYHEWIIPLNDHTTKFLKENKFDIDERLLKWKADQFTKLQTKIKSLNLPKGLYRFQVEGVWFIAEHNGRALIADDMGLGKTVQALAWLYARPDLRPALIIVPAALKLNWRRKAKEWIPWARPIILYGMGAGENLVRDAKDICIVNYDLLDLAPKRRKGERLKAFLERYKEEYKPLYKDLMKVNFRCLILDECHYLANGKAYRTKAVRKLSRGIESVVALSGTPITSRPIQFFVILNILVKEVFHSLWKFAHKYCGAKHNGFGWDFSGTSNAEELHNLLIDTVMIRRKKSDVIDDLPEKIRDIVPLEITNRKEYNKADHDFVGWLRSRGEHRRADRAERAEQLARIEGLKQLTLQGKMQAVIEWIEGFIESNTGKLAVFTHHVEVRKILVEHFGPEISVEAKGGSKNQLAEDKFQKDPNIRLFFGGIDSAGVGLTLTEAKALAVVELPATPGKLKQVEDRIYARLNDIHGALIYLLVASNTIEEDMAEILDRKTKVLDKVLDGEDTDEETLLTELIERKLKRK